LPIANILPSPSTIEDRQTEFLEDGHIYKTRRRIKGMQSECVTTGKAIGQVSEKTRWLTESRALVVTQLQNADDIDALEPRAQIQKCIIQFVQEYERKAVI
jgi:hypothetical protein